MRSPFRRVSKRDAAGVFDTEGLSTRPRFAEINIAGLPGLTVPAGIYASGSPFGLIFIGKLFSEAEIIGLGHAYESTTQHRKPPVL